MTPRSSSALLLPLIAVTLLTKCGCMDIIRGHKVRPHSWPYMAAIQNKNLDVSCGGALVEKQWVLTAAHCDNVLEKGICPKALKTNLTCVPGTKPQNTTRDEVELDGETIPLILSDLGSQTQNVAHDCDKEPCPFDKLNVRTSMSSPGGILRAQLCCWTADSRIDELEDRVVLGAHRVSVAQKEQQIFNIMEIFRHREFELPSGKNDIMLLKLNDTAKMNKYVQLLPLPDCFEDVKPGTLCKVAGWGNTSPGKPSEYLQEANLKTVDRKSCDKKYANKPKITTNMLCAIGKNRLSPSDTCQGDSGGPLICAGQYRGIVSFGRKCGRRGIPGVYTLLTKEYTVWINETISRDRDP